jgi:hypothetical protein
MKALYYYPVVYFVCLPVLFLLKLLFHRFQMLLLFVLGGLHVVMHVHAQTSNFP